MIHFIHSTDQKYTVRTNDEIDPTVEYIQLEEDYDLVSKIIVILRADVKNLYIFALYNSHV